MGPWGARFLGRWVAKRAMGGFSGRRVAKLVERWVARFLGRWAAKLVARLLATASLKNTKWAS